MNKSFRFLIPAALMSVLMGVPAGAHFTSQSSEQLQLAVGEAKTISLTENPSTGYEWKAALEESSNLDAVRIDDLGYEPADSHLLGAPGKHSWRIVGVTAGKARLVLNYFRSWESAPPAQRHIVHIDVTAAP